jgi:hypothetical protein
MIKNIPNKYTQKMLLEKIDINHCGCYDFFYLPIDVTNNCNVGSAFINMTDPLFVLALNEELNGCYRERFSSEKIAHLRPNPGQGRSCR